MPPLSRRTIKQLAVSLPLTAVIIWCFFHFIVIIVVNEPDEFWHLWSGRLIAETGRVTRTDPAGILTANYDWINLNWLAQLISYRAFLNYGLAGPATISAWLASIVFLCHFARLPRWGTGIGVTTLSTMLVFRALYYDYSSRPQLYSFAFLAVLAFLLDRYSEQRRMPLPVAAAISVGMLLWNNLHGGAIFGYALLFSDMVAALIAGLRNGGSYRNALLNPRIFTVGGIITLSLIGFVLHPHSFDALHHMLTYSSSMHQIFYEKIRELQPIHLFSVSGTLFIVFLFATACGIFHSPQMVWHRNFIAIVIFSLLTLKMQRLFPPLIFIGAPFTIGLLTRIPLLSRVDKVDSGTALALTSVIQVAMLAYWSVAIVPIRTPERHPGCTRSLLIDNESFPANIVERIRDQPLPGRIYEAYPLGGYLGWALYPQKRRILIDGRGDLHSQGNGYERYLMIRAAEPGFEQELDKLEIDLIVDQHDTGVIQKLRTSPNWKVELEESSWVLLRRATASESIPN
jgi:hypothetical protein